MQGIQGGNGMSDKNDGINLGHFHEIIDRVHIICSMIDEFLIDHPGMTEEMNARCEGAQILLGGVTDCACWEEERFCAIHSCDLPGCVSCGNPEDEE